MSGTTQANPQIALGSLNRLRTSLTIPSFPALNVSAPNLGRDGITVTPEGAAVAYLPALTGAVVSPEAFQMVRIRIALLKTQPIAGFYISQYQLNALVGLVNVKTDSVTFPTLAVVDCSIANIPDMRFAGQTPDIPVELLGIWQVNSSIFNPI